MHVTIWGGDETNIPTILKEIIIAIHNLKLIYL
jgi:hypothetical protein